MFESVGVIYMVINSQVATQVFALVWHARWVSISGGLTPSSERKYLNTIDGWAGPKRN